MSTQTNHAYRFSFNPKDGGGRITWIRCGRSMEEVLELAKRAALSDYPNAGGFLISGPEPI